MVTLLRHLDRIRFQPMLAVVNSSQAVFLEDIPEDVEFIDLGCRRVRYALPAILRLIWRTRPQLVLSTLGHLNLALAVTRFMFPAETKLIGRETIIVTQNVQYLANTHMWLSAYRWFYPRLDALICQSDDMFRDVVDHLGFPAHKTLVIHNPVDFQQIRSALNRGLSCGMKIQASSNLKLVAAGRLVEQKGFSLLFEALALCPDIDLFLTLLGEGPLESELRNKAASLNIEDRVEFVGFQKNPYPWFKCADAFVISSLYEGFPNVVLEALACGTPVIATPAPGGLRELLKPIPSCQLAEVVSAESLASAIRTWVERRPSRIGDKEIADYAVEAIVRKYERVMLNVVTEAA